MLTSDIESKIPSSPVIGGSLSGFRFGDHSYGARSVGNRLGLRCPAVTLFILFYFFYFISLFICFTIVTQSSYRSKLLYSIFFIFLLWMSIPHLDSIPLLLRFLFTTSFFGHSQTKAIENGPRPRTGRDGMNQFAWEIQFTCVQCTCASTCTCIERRMGGTA
jgi:hypothetical protein